MMSLKTARCLAAAVSTVLLMTVAMPAAQASTATYAAGVLKYTNAERASRHLATVKQASCVNYYAQKQAAKIARERKLSHQNLTTLLNACKLTRVSENVVYGYPTGQGAVKAWMNSSVHRKNLLDPNMRLIGIGAAQDSKGVWWAAQVFGRQ